MSTNVHATLAVLAHRIATEGLPALLPSRLRRDDRGEGVISTALTVLIIAFLGAVMYVVFRTLVVSSGRRASTTVHQIGQ